MNATKHRNKSQSKPKPQRDSLRTTPLAYGDSTPEITIEKNPIYRCWGVRLGSHWGTLLRQFPDSMDGITVGAYLMSHANGPICVQIR